jgi:predicted P-loop ATPase
MVAAVRDYGIQRERGINVAHAREALQVIANRNRYHPVKRYLEALHWDGQDYIAGLSEYVTEKDPGTFRKWFAHWLTGAVARVYEPWQTPVLVLEGGQELGKSFFCQWLCPEPSLFYAGSVCPDDRDSRIRRMSVWIWEIEELGATTRRQDQEALKAFITSTMIQDRRPYGHYDVLKPALTSFIGTLNNDAGFLMDRTGNRRFLVTPLEKIDWSYARDISRDGLWAQAMEIYRSGNDWKLTDEDRKERDAQNDNYMVDDPVEVRLEALYQATGKPTDFIATDTILASLHSDGFGYSRGLAMSVASVLKSWGCEAARVRTEGGPAERGYRGIAIK